MTHPSEAQLMSIAEAQAAGYLQDIDNRRVFPDAQAIAALSGFDQPLNDAPRDPAQTLALLETLAAPATVASNGPRYFGFVIGAALPVAAAAARIALAWDQCSSSHVNSPAIAAIEKAAARLVLEALDLPRDSAIGFGTSATACGLSCLATARRTLLKRAGWDFDRDGLIGAPELRVVVPETAHITVLKALRVLGFGMARILRAPCDAHGRIEPLRLPELDARTILCLQAGEVNTGEFDRFVEIIPRAREAGAWVHVDGAFGLWARAAESTRALTAGIELADSWTTDGHKWLNTPYDGAMAICRHADAMAASMNADAPYAKSEPDAQKNLTLEFSRRGRGLPIWAALHSLGREGVAELVERHCRQARRLAEGLRGLGLEVINRVVLNQVLVRAASDEATLAILNAVQQGGEIWFGGSRWQERPAFRLSVSSWRTTDAVIERAIAEVGRAVRSVGDAGS
jgi:glutamate/tyrosine decarboxylase-like PLP-dependent enzyme